MIEVVERNAGWSVCINGVHTAWYTDKGEAYRWAESLRVEWAMAG